MTTIALLAEWSSPSAVLASNEVRATDISPPSLTPVRDSLGWRLGFLNYGLIDSGQGRPFLYLDAGLRYKTDQAYVDLKMPFIAGGVDFFIYWLQDDVLGVQKPFNLFEGLNEPIHFGSFMELGQARLGQTYTTYPFETPGEPAAPLRLTAGILGVADFVFFDLALANQDPEDFDGVDQPGANDPFIGALGGFISMGGDAPHSEYDIALGVARDLFHDDQYTRNNGWVLLADLEVEIDVAEDFGTYLRWRTSAYTHILTTPIVTMALNFGVVVRVL